MESKDCLVQGWRVGWAKDAIGDSIEGALPVYASTPCLAMGNKDIRKGGHCEMLLLCCSVSEPVSQCL